MYTFSMILAPNFHLYKALLNSQSAVSLASEENGQWVAKSFRRCTFYKSRSKQQLLPSRGIKKYDEIGILIPVRNGYNIIYLFNFHCNFFRNSTVVESLGVVQCTALLSITPIASQDILCTCSVPLFPQDQTHLQSTHLRFRVYL